MDGNKCEIMKYLKDEVIGGLHYIFEKCIHSHKIDVFIMRSNWEGEWVKTFLFDTNTKREAIKFITKTRKEIGLWK